MKSASSYNDLIARGAVVALAGYLLSGPIGFFFVRLIHPQPDWISAEVFSQNYHAVQDIPYYFGFLLIAGMLMVITGQFLNYQSTDIRGKFRLMLSVGLCILFSALISFNYICQTTFVRNLAIDYRPEYDSAIRTFSMANTRSLAWSIEMWGYSFLGLATALSAVYYKNNLLSFLLIFNGVISLAGALITAVDVSWVMTIGGLVSYFGWNVMMIVIMSLIYLECKNGREKPELA